ncbi:MAG: DUF1995 family protein [Synechococcales cyanobacterium M58_A2018_015]|nr:DUF1995 family protein [Synechococcales cyanobacterium M58_A2018_015]
MPALPQTLEEAVEQAKAATQAALDDGYTRLQVELLFPELKVLPVAQQFLPAFEDWGNQLRVYFPDAGAAALARRDWGEKPYAIRGIRDLNAEILPEERLIIFVEPSSVEVQEVERLCQVAMERPVLLLNPRLEDIATIGIGLAGRQLRERFLALFDSCYYLQPLDGAAIFRAYPSPWQVWVEQESDYQLVAESPQKPIGEALERILTGAAAESPETVSAPRKQGFLGSLQQFIRALSQ